MLVTYMNGAGNDFLLQRETLLLRVPLSAPTEWNTIQLLKTMKP